MSSFTSKLGYVPYAQSLFLAGICSNNQSAISLKIAWSIWFLSSLAQFITFNNTNPGIYQPSLDATRPSFKEASFSSFFFIITRWDGRGGSSLIYATTWWVRGGWGGGFATTNLIDRKARLRKRFLWEYEGGRHAIGVGFGYERYVMLSLIMNCHSDETFFHRGCRLLPWWVPFHVRIPFCAALKFYRERGKVRANLRWGCGVMHKVSPFDHVGHSRQHRAFSRTLPKHQLSTSLRLSASNSINYTRSTWSHSLYLSSFSIQSMGSAIVLNFDLLLRIVFIHFS